MTTEHICLPFESLERWKTTTAALEQKITNVSQLSSAITALLGVEKDSTLLHKLITEAYTEEQRLTFFNDVIPFLQKLVLDSPSIFEGFKIPILKQNTNAQVSLSRKQVACILATAFFCAFEIPSDESKWNLLSSMNYDDLYTKPMSNVQAKLAKLQMILHYFFRIQKDGFSNGSLVVQRIAVPRTSIPNWSQSNKPLTTMNVHPKEVIADFPDSLQVDFANEFIGGATLSYGLAQEETRFAACPELIVSKLFCEKMRVTEAILITGAECFCKHEGYGSKLQFGADYKETNLDQNGCCQTALVAIDAFKFRDPFTQWSKMFIDRELNKAYAGFHVSIAGTNSSSSSSSATSTTTSSATSTSNTTAAESIATGFWGCGIFNGDKELKALLQWLVASQVGKDVHFITFNNEKQTECLTDFAKEITSLSPAVTVGQVYNALLKLESSLIEVDEESGMQTILSSTFTEVVKILKTTA